MFQFINEKGFERYGPVGVEYRTAIENEWRKKIGRKLEKLPNVEGPLTFGKMLGVVQTQARTAFGAAWLKNESGRETSFLDQRFMQRAFEALEVLNAAAHAEGLEREKCVVLRDKLLRGGLLRDLLGAVQKAG